MTAKIYSLMLIFSIIIAIATTSCSKEADGRDAEDEAIEKFLKKYGDTCFVSYNGIYLYLTEEGTEKYSNGDLVTITYTGQTLENVVTFANQNVMQVVYGNNSLISGWQTALEIIPKNSAGILLIPFKKGYGKKRVGVIEPYSTLAYTFTAE